MEEQSSAQQASKKSKSGRPRRRPLRKEKLVRAVMAVLGQMVNLSPKTDPINVSSVAKRVGVTRQAIYDNNLKAAIDEHSELQRANASVVTEAAALRRPLEMRLAEQKKENEELQRKLDGWIERWVTVEYNARMGAQHPDDLFAPMPMPSRVTSIFRKGGKGKRGR